MIGDAWEAVGNVDDAASDKAVAFRQCLHYLVVGMCIQPEIYILLFAPGDDTAADAVYASVRSEAMDDVVRLVVQPLAVINDCVCRIRPRRKAESGHDSAVFIAAHITVPKFRIK